MALYFSTEFYFNLQKIGDFGGREGSGRGRVWEREMEKDKGKEREGERDFIFSRKQAG